MTFLRRPRGLVQTLALDRAGQHVRDAAMTDDAGEALVLSHGAG